MRYALMAALIGSTAIAAPAFAQDANPTFTGPRVGVIVGYDNIRPGSSEDTDLDNDDEDTDGFLYGVEAGYDVAVGNKAVVGIEGELSDSTAETDPYDGDAQFGYGNVETGRDLYIGARAGILATPSTLVYAKGGYTNARLDLTTDYGERINDEHYNLDGYRIGAGVEQAIGGNAYAKVEYRYSNYGDARLEFDDGSNTDNFSVDTDRHQLVAGVGMRF
ncbi:outer membrane protein [Stakelama saccharophila]|uniref:Outer membrane beta-barrel protein n=1 Tax=Stakelama saccharophila TaxID=3075605 RepID=A0ABZ0BA67_9SPHN|nr:outer membrane beta-barrel protein [Stakelama sp. W311]WNO54168.1 outer membrane beta-barrel protein [Stakelama sp. W311]